MAVGLELFDSFIGHVGGARVDLDSDTFKAVLTNVEPDYAEDEDLADITQISDGSGYTTGGVTLTSVAWTEPTDGVWQFDAADFEWNATGGSIGAFQWVVIYSDTSTDDKLVGAFNFGTPLTIPDGSFFRVVVGANGLIQWGVGTIT